MSDKKPRRSRVLKNVTNTSNSTANLTNSIESQEENIYNASTNSGQGSSEKENKFSFDNTKIAKDSEEETDYHRTFLDQSWESLSSGTCTLVNVAVQCNILSNDTMLKDLIKQCSELHTVDHCKQLQDTLSSNNSLLSVRGDESGDNERVTEISLCEDKSNMVSNSEQPTSPGISNEFLPTKGRVSNNGFHSESFDFGISNPNTEGVTEKFGKDGGSSNIDDFTKQPTKPANNGRTKGKIRYKTMVRRRYETRSVKSHVKMLESKQDSASTYTTGSNNGRKLRKRPFNENNGANSIKRFKKETKDIVEDILSSKPNSTGSSKRKKNVPHVTLEYVSGDVTPIYIGIQLPKRQTRAMGKNWKNAKRIIKACDIPVFRQVADSFNQKLV